MPRYKKYSGPRPFPPSLALSLIFLAGAGLSCSGPTNVSEPLHTAGQPPGSVLPVTTIEKNCMDVGGYIFEAGPQFKIRWHGEDLDSLYQPDAIAFYEWKLVPVDNAIAVTDADYFLNGEPGAPYSWVRAEGDNPTVTLALTPPQDFIFGVRAIDSDGNLENTFSFARNAMRISRLLSGTSFPVLTVTEPGLGQHVFPSDGNEVFYDVLDNCLDFRFQATAVTYCGRIEGFNYGIDVADPDTDGPGSGFRGWSTKPFAEPICLEPGDHVVTVKARDDNGVTTTGTIHLRVLPFSNDHKVLYVDDFRQASYQGITDAFMDARARDMLEAAGYSAADIVQFDPWGPTDGNALPLSISLSELARYELVVWSVLGVGFGGMTALNTAVQCPGTQVVLRQYAQAGGAVWIFGQLVFGAMKHFGPSSSCLGSFNYDLVTGLHFESPEFVCDILHICSEDVRDVKSAQNTHGLERALPTPIAAADLFPHMDVDSTVFNVGALGAVPFIDAAFDLIPEPGLDVLYTEDAASPASSWNGKPIGFRYASPDNSQGPVAVFGFPLHVLKPGSAVDRTGVHGMARAMIEWFQSYTEGSTP